MTSAALRALAREALAQAGARGFVRFLPPGDGALLATDAVARCADEAALVGALESRGFAAARRGALLALTPGDALLLSMAGEPPTTREWDWDGPLAPAFALADRWLRAPEGPLTPSGRRLALETARLLWLPEAQALRGMGALRAQAAAMQRARDVGALRLCGGILLAWCEEREKARSHQRLGTASAAQKAADAKEKEA